MARFKSKVMVDTGGSPGMGTVRCQASCRSPLILDLDSKTTQAYTQVISVGSRGNPELRQKSSKARIKS